MISNTLHARCTYVYTFAHKRQSVNQHPREKTHFKNQQKGSQFIKKRLVYTGMMTRLVNTIKKSPEFQ